MIYGQDETAVTAEPLSFLPLTEQTFAILLSLAAGQKHGYAILKDVSDLSDGRVTLSTSTLYSALGRMLDQGLIERVPAGPDADSGPGLPRKAYQLTELGRRVLAGETKRMLSLADVARLRLGEEGA